MLRFSVSEGNTKVHRNDMPGPQGARQGAEAQELNNSASPTPPSFHWPAWGGGPQLFHYLAVSRPRKASWSHWAAPESFLCLGEHPHGLSLWLPRGLMALQIRGHCENSSSSQHCSCGRSAAPDGYLNSSLWPAVGA